jgi:hypothetical protein
MASPYCGDWNDTSSCPAVEEEAARADAAEEELRRVLQAVTNIRDFAERHVKEEFDNARGSDTSWSAARAGGRLDVLHALAAWAETLLRRYESDTSAVLEPADGRAAAHGGLATGEQRRVA